ncbi:MAG: hypothetical protein GXO88_04435 [Chlorobi bacterium]|nr:hypothetical protein [Chlorobiota bacterium]
MTARTFVILLFLNIRFLYCQDLQIVDTLLNTTDTYEDIISVSWKGDGSAIVFCATDSLGIGIFVYNLDAAKYSRVYRDSLLLGDVVWHPDNQHIVYDKKTGRQSSLFIRDIEKDIEASLFNRNIPARQPSFSNNDDLVVFSGFDIINDNWQVYTYDFVYDNLNQLTKGDFNCADPVFSPDGKHILYEKTQPGGDTLIEMINWYGNFELRVEGGNARSPNWKSDSWRFIYVVEAQHSAEVYSSRRNGDGVYRLTHNGIDEVAMTFSPDNQFVTMIVEEKANKVLFILSVE